MISDQIYFMYYNPKYKFFKLENYYALIKCFLARANDVPRYYVRYYVHMQGNMLQVMILEYSKEVAKEMCMMKNQAFYNVNLFSTI